MNKENVMTARQAKAIFIANFDSLPEKVKQAVEFTISNWRELNIEEAKFFLSDFGRLPRSPQESDKETRQKLSDAVNTLKKFPEVWLSLENLPQEEWRDVVGYENYYKVSNYGRVKSFKRGVQKIFHVAQDKDGYELVNLSGNGRSRNVGVHVLVAEAFINNPKDKPQVNHYNGVKFDNCIWNLEWNTATENAQHALEFGLTKQGADRPESKLTPEQVIYIRRVHIWRHPEFGARALAKQFNVTRKVIENVVNHKTYKNIP